MSNCKLCLADCAFSGKDMKKGTCKGYIPMTNSDRIRSMSDEELAKWFLSAGICIRDFEDCSKCDGVSCRQCRMNWLKQPAEEDT